MKIFNFSFSKRLFLALCVLIGTKAFSQTTIFCPFPEDDPTYLSLKQKHEQEIKEIDNSYKTEFFFDNSHRADGMQACISHKTLNCEVCRKLVSEKNALKDKELLASNTKFRTACKKIHDEYCAKMVKEEEEKKQQAQNDAFNKTIKEGKKLEDEGKFTESKAKYTEAKNIKSTPAVDDKIKSVEKKEAEKKKKEEKKEEKETKKQEKNNKKVQEVYSYQKTQFDYDNEYAQQRNARYQQNESSSKALAASLAVFWAGTYFFPTPVKSIYERKGMFFSIGPTNSAMSVPTYENLFYLKETQTAYYYGNKIDKKIDTSAKAGTMIFTPNFGLKTEFGWMGDAIQLTFPIKGAFGIFTENSLCWSANAGVNLFLGLPNSKRFKIGGGFEYCYQKGSMYRNSYYPESGSFPDPNTGWPTTYNTFSSFDYTSSYLINYTTIKFGFRYHKYLNSRTGFNNSEPFIFDLFFTQNTVKDITKEYNSNLIHQVYPGIEFSISKIGIFGVYGKVIPMKPVGELRYHIEETASTNPYFEVGIKREYAWFKSRKK